MSLPIHGIDDCWSRIGVRGDRSCPELVEHVHCRNCPVYGAAAREILDGELPDGYRDQWTRHFAPPREAQAQDATSMVIFRLGAEWLALPASSVAEIVDRRLIHTLPHPRRDMVLGLVNVRGELLACVSLAGLLGLGSAQGTEDARGVYPRLLVIQGEGGRLVFPADEVYGIQRCERGELREAPVTVAKSQTPYASAVFSWHERTVGLLDAQLVHYGLSRSLG
jgi:chemotaxis-related protein WspD